MGTKRLSELGIRAWLKHREPKKLFDGDGLYLTVTPAGTAVWRLRYRYAGADRTLALGTHREIGLRGARDGAEAARAQLRAGSDPMIVKRVTQAQAAASAAVTFKDCALEWVEKRRLGWSKSHYKTVTETLERHVFDHIGPLPISEISQAMVAAVVERVGDRIDTAQKVRQQIAGVFRLAMARGKLPGVTSNPADAAREVIDRRVKQEHFPALLEFDALGDLLRRARRAQLAQGTHVAHRLCAFTATRLGNVVEADWREFDLAAGEWVIPRQKMKLKDRPFDHLVILGPVMLEELRTWHRLNGAPGSGWVFPSKNGKHGHMPHDTVEKVYRKTLGLRDRHVPHGWRSAFSTLATEKGGFEDGAVDMVLDHVTDDKVARAYDRGDRRPQRVELAHWWERQLVDAEAGTPAQAAR